jgi:hypothetical protein
VWVDNGNSWTRQKSSDTLDHPGILNDYLQIAKLVPTMWEKIIYLSAGEKEIPGWSNMSDPSARELHRSIMDVIRFAVPYQVMIDDFWISLRREARFVESYDRYPFGCMNGTPGAYEALDELATRLGKW